MPMKRTSSKPNGHAGHSRLNGHGPASTEGGGTSVPRGPAASDDTRSNSAAMGAGSAPASGTACEEYAEAAPPPPIGALPTSSSGRTSPRSGETGTGHEETPGGDSPLPLQPSEFVEEVHRRADLIISWVNLVNSDDEKIRQRAIEKLTEMRYKGVAALEDEPQIIWDVPRPKRD